MTIGVELNMSDIPRSHLGGNGFNWESLNRPAGMPLITIITSTFNAKEELPWTIASIRAQRYPYLQWIIADGGSTDGTLSILQDNSDIVNFWFSEKDEGIYDAWNKALKYARGDWIQFLGAGDELADCNLFNKIHNTLHHASTAFDLVYGDVLLVTEDKRIAVKRIGEPWPSMKGQWETFRPKLPMHPGIFHHKSLFTTPPFFSPHYKIAGDSHFLLKSILKNDPLYIPILVDIMPTGGVSSSLAGSIKSTREILKLNKELGITPPLVHKIVELARFNFKILVKVIVPVSRQKKLLILTKLLRSKLSHTR